MKFIKKILRIIIFGTVGTFLNLFFKTKVYLYAVFYNLNLIKKLPNLPQITNVESRALLTDWYHDFSLLGFKTNQFRDPSYFENQKAKVTEMVPLISKAISLCQTQFSKAPSVLELFCADGFYGQIALQNGANNVVGYDLESEDGKRIGILSQAALISKILGTQKRTKFLKEDVFNCHGNYEIIICAGGLYHIENPLKLIKHLHSLGNKYLIIQTVVSNENHSPDYFESPSPQWTWGCRFSHDYLKNNLAPCGWKIINESFNLLPGNENPNDKGSSYFLCEKI